MIKSCPNIENKSSYRPYAKQPWGSNRINLETRNNTEKSQTFKCGKTPDSDTHMKVLNMLPLKALNQNLILGMPKIICHMIGRCVNIWRGLILILDPIQKLYPCDAYTKYLIKSDENYSQYRPDTDLSHGRMDDGWKNGRTWSIQYNTPPSLLPAPPPPPLPPPPPQERQLRSGGYKKLLYCVTILNNFQSRASNYFLLKWHVWYHLHQLFTLAHFFLSR